MYSKPRYELLIFDKDQTFDNIDDSVYGKGFSSNDSFSPAWNTAFTEGTTNLFRSNMENESFFESALDQQVSTYFYPENVRSYVRNLIRHHYLQTARFYTDKSTDWLRMTVQMLSAHLFFAPAIKEAQLLAKHSKNVFVHSLDFVSDGFQWNDSAKGVPHGMDIFYLFAVSPENLGWRYSEKENQIINLMGTMWTNFAKSGDPNRPVPLKPFPLFYALNKTSKWQYFSIDLPPRMNPFYKIDDVVLFNNLIPEQMNLIRNLSCQKSSETFAENRSSSNLSVFSIFVNRHKAAKI
uniref:Carboxylesterase type B domain-containing protein n=1 Tax=Romanomermis culicivorax TaxID=13658 RepID=A0A915KZE0_ROMCU